MNWWTFLQIVILLLLTHGIVMSWIRERRKDK